MQIREATPADLAAMLALGAQMHAESPRFELLHYDETKVEALLYNAMSDPAYFLMVAEQKKGDIVGGFLGFAAPMWFSADEVAADLALFIKQDRRGSMAAVALVRAFIAWARAREVKQINLGISTGVKVEQTADLYKALGLKMYGYLFEA